MQCSLQEDSAAVHCIPWLVGVSPEMWIVSPLLPFILPEPDCKPLRFDPFQVPVSMKNACKCTLMLRLRLTGMLHAGSARRVASMHVPQSTAIQQANVMKLSKQHRNNLTYYERHEHVQGHAYASETQHHRKGISDFRGTARLGLSKRRVMTVQKALISACYERTIAVCRPRFSSRLDCLGFHA